MGQYIAMARAEDGTLRRIVTLLAKLSLYSANPLPRWGKSVLIMLEKGKGPHVENCELSKS